MKRRTKSILSALLQAVLAFLLVMLLAMILQSSAPAPAAPQRTLHILTTNDIHGNIFSSHYSKEGKRKSLECVKWQIDSVREAVGASNVLLIDAGDGFQGDNAAYYFNYVDTLGVHPMVRMAKYMAYDAVTVGNHDIETGHPVYDRLDRQFSKAGIPFLAGNAIKEDGSTYFREYKLVRRAGMKVLVLGYTNANIKQWLGEDLWKGMDFVSLVPYVQRRVDSIKALVKPDITVVSVHSGTGNGDGQQLENQGLDLFSSLKGVDVLLCAHDHKPFVKVGDDIVLVNSGSHARFVGHATVRVGADGSREFSGELIRTDWSKYDERMDVKFRKDFDKVKDFTNAEVGNLAMDLRTADAYGGMCSYINFIHTVQLTASGAQISFAAPLTFNGTVRTGKLVYGDMFTIYPFENSLFVIRLTGRQIKDYLEYSYALWTGDGSDGHALKIQSKADSRTGQDKWSFKERHYNLDSAGGLVYEVDPYAPAGSKVSIRSLADGTPFSFDASYTVALTSYRANGGGGHLIRGAGIPHELLPSLVEGRYPDIRTLVYEFVRKYGELTPALVGNVALTGEWRFTPASEAAVAADLELLFPKRFGH